MLFAAHTRLIREEVVQSGLLDAELRQRQQALDQAADDIRETFGKDAVRRGSLRNRPEVD